MTLLLDKLKRYWAYAISIVGFIGQFTVLLGLFSSIFSWGNKCLFSFIRNNYLIIWLTSLTLITIACIYWVIVINRRFILGFSDSFKKRLNSNWDFVGPWTITDENILIVSNSDEGGITKKGSEWENYSFSFTAKIVTNCIGVIVRASDLNNYYMFQFGKGRIVPHRRITYTQIIKKSLDHMILPELEMKTGWQIFNEFSKDLNKELEDWFEGCIKVKGQTVSVYIDNALVFHEESFLKIPKGKVGFRCWGPESGQIKKIKVRLDIE